MNKILKDFWGSGCLRFLWILILTMFIAVGCGGGGDGDSSDNTPNQVTPTTGQFIDSSVQGLSYQTATQSGVTDELGTFQYIEGETITFRIGTMELGQAIGGEVITPIDLVDGATDANNTAVINICRLLQTLDDDGNPDNGITITVTIQNSMNGMQFSFSNMAEFGNQIQSFIGQMNDVNAFLNGIRGIVSEEDARAHFEQFLHGVDTTFWYKDSDSDGYGDSSGLMQSATQPFGYVANKTDCNDNDASVHPGATEVCGDGVDNDCNGAIDDGCSINGIMITGTIINFGDYDIGFTESLYLEITPQPENPSYDTDLLSADITSTGSFTFELPELPAGAYNFFVQGAGPAPSHYCFPVLLEVVSTNPDGSPDEIKWMVMDIPAGYSVPLNIDLGDCAIQCVD